VHDAIDLDANATTRPSAAVVAAMREALEAHWGNPSSVHRRGMEARHRVDLARESVAKLLGCRSREVLFTSGGTESANLAIRGVLDRFRGGPRRVLATSRLEHSAVRECAEHLERRGEAEVVWLPHDAAGVVDLEALESLLGERSQEVALVSLMWANNETGVVAPVEAIGERCRAAGVLFHCDAVQWAGRHPVGWSGTPVDLLTASAHKFHGPKGVGVLVARGSARFEAQLVGGPQERERRGGTENLPGIVGLGVAAEEAIRSIEAGRWSSSILRDRLEAGVLARCPSAVVHGAAATRLPTTSNIAFPGLEAEAMLVVLSESGVYASAGAACSSGSLDPSPVLLAMGIAPDVAHGSVRFSLSDETTGAEIDEAIERIASAHARLSRSMV
jgi:cysteine desulfurase